MFRENECSALDFVFSVILIAFSIIVLSIVSLLLLNQIHNLNDTSYVNAVATAFIAVFTLCTVYISFQLKRISEGQAITQMNQAFNEINQLILNNEKIRNIAKEYIRSNEESHSKTKICIDRLCEDKELKTWFIFSVLNIYEAYYINNKSAFSGGHLPLIIENLRRDEFVQEIVLAHRYHPGFQEIFKCNNKTDKPKQPDQPSVEDQETRTLQ